MTQPYSSSNIISLHDVLNYHDDLLALYSLNETPHPQQTFLAWLIKNTLPKYIAIFDAKNQLTQTSISILVTHLKTSSQCYSILSQHSKGSFAETLIPLTTDLSLSFFSLIYVNIEAQTIEEDPILSSLKNEIPKNLIFVFTNIYSQNSITKNNRKFIHKWKEFYPYFELSHHNGLLLFYTGTPISTPLKELFSLKNNLRLEQCFKNYCSVLDEYLFLKVNSFQSRNSNIKEQIIEAKTETYLLQQKNYYQEKKYINKINSLINQNNIYQEHFIWQQNIKEKIKSIQYVLNKYPIINLILPKKIKQLLTFPSAPSKFIPCSKQTEVDLIKTHAHIPTATVSVYNRNIIFIAGEPHTPGVIYRCYRNAEACIMAGHQAKVINAAEVSPEDIQWADILIFWRVEFSGHILGIVELAKQYGTLTAFDADDIVFKSHFAYIEIIDGIRTIGTTEAETSRTFGNMKQTLMRTDFAVATTQEMREHMAQELIPKHAGPLVFVLPNVFDDECVQISRFFNRIEQARKNDEYIRIGYASGTRTHQRDFALVIPALLTIFKKRPNVRLVLFREPDNHRSILHMNEFPELNDFQDRIEWRDTVPLKKLPQELARFDISIAPLEYENVFCNAKSELKFFEAALANTCSVISPTGPLKRCVKHGITGFLAYNTHEWTEYLLTLIDDPALRDQMAQNAYHDVLWNFSTQRQSYLCDTMLLSLTGEKGAAQAMETMIARKDYKSLSLPFIPESEILFNHDALQESEVTVVITSYNYSNYIIEAMESVRAQTLQQIDMIIVDDGSTDDSIDLIIAWAKEHKNRFNRLQLHRSLKNTGLGGARNIGVAASETLYSMQLDADNLLVPDSCEKLLAKIQGTAIGYAYPRLRHFGAGEATGGHIPFHPLRLTVGNYIDAMVMLAKWAWAAAGGYYVQRDAMGWEDYDIWCRLAELGIQGTQVADAIAEYRAHFSSMTNTVTEQTYHKPKVTSYLAERHPWIKLVLPEDSPWIQKKSD